MNRLFHIDLARTVAILLVTTFHLSRRAKDHPLLGPFDLYGVFAHGYIGVDLFFVISGYVMVMTWRRLEGEFPDKAKAFLKARFLRLMPAYVVAIIFWIVVIRTTGMSKKPTGALDIITHLTFTHTLFTKTFFSISGVMWSLAVEVHFYLLFPLIIWLSVTKRWLLCGTAIVFAITVWSIWPISGQSRPYQWNVITFLPLFMLGMAIHDLPKNRFENKALAFWVLIGIVAAAMMLLPNWGQDLMVRLVLGAMLGFAFVAASPFRDVRGIAGKFISRIGAASYSIYLYNYVYPFFGKSLHGLPGIIIYSAGVFAFGSVMWWLVDRNFERMRHERKRRLAAQTA